MKHFNNHHDNQIQQSQRVHQLHTIQCSYDQQTLWFKDINEDGGSSIVQDLQQYDTSQSSETTKLDNFFHGSEIFEKTNLTQTCKKHTQSQICGENCKKSNSYVKNSNKAN